MRGLPQSWPLTVDRILDHARAWRPTTEIAARTPDGRVVRITYAELHRRARRLSTALQALGVEQGDSVAVIGANSLRQVEAWYAIAGIGAVCHPINPRLPTDRLVATLRDGGDKAVLIDPDLLGGLEAAIAAAPGAPAVVVMTDASHAPATALANLHIHDTLVDEASGEAGWGGFDEDAPAVLLHTLGATGDPRPVVWTHRAATLSAMIAKGPDALDLSAGDVAAALMPFARAGGFGLIFAAPAAGARLVLPGPRTDAPSVHALLENEAVTFALASPADVQGLFDHLMASGGRLTKLKRIVAAGGQCLPTLARDFKDRFGVQVLNAWGLTETAGLGAVTDAAGEMRPPFGLEVEVTDASGNALPRDNAAIGRIKARGPAVAAPGEGGAQADARGFLDTGDLGAIDAEGRLRFTDRASEIIKAGGQWISPRVIEAAAHEHPATAEAAVIAWPDSAGVESPLLVVRRRPGGSAGKAEYIAFLQRRLARGQIPVDILFVDGLPLDAVGRIDKRTLRERLERHRNRGEGKADVTAAPVAALAAAPVLYAPAPPPPDPEPVSADTPQAVGESAPQSDTVAPEAIPADPTSGNDATADSPQPEEPAAAEPESHEVETMQTDAAASAGNLIDWSEAPFDAPAGPVALTDEAAIDANHELPIADRAPAIESRSALAPKTILSPVADPEAPGLQDELAVAALPDELEGGPAPDASVVEPPSTPVTRIVDASVETAEEARLALAPARRRKTPRGMATGYLNAAVGFGLLPLLVIVLGALAIRFGLIEAQFGTDEVLSQWPFQLAMIGVVTGLIGLFVALFSGFRRVWRRAVLGLAIPVVTIAVLIAVQSRAEGQPPIHQASTNWVEPVNFSPELLRLRGAQANPVVAEPYVPAGERLFANRTVADVNAETCRGARPARIAADPLQAYARVKAAVAGLGWEIITDRPAEGQLEATASSPLLGFRDDLAVRVAAEGDGARVDARSVSRLGRTDQGRNCAHVSRLMAGLGG